jgi:hypothetical protein
MLGLKVGTRSPLARMRLFFRGPALGRLDLGLIFSFPGVKT